jgi:hypothetical protein
MTSGWPGLGKQGFGACGCQAELGQARASTLVYEYWATCLLLHPGPRADQNSLGLKLRGVKVHKFKEVDRTCFDTERKGATVYTRQGRSA